MLVHILQLFLHNNTTTHGFVQYTSSFGPFACAHDKRPPTPCLYSIPHVALSVPHPLLQLHPADWLATPPGAVHDLVDITATQGGCCNAVALWWHAEGVDGRHMRNAVALYYLPNRHVYPVCACVGIYACGGDMHVGDVHVWGIRMCGGHVCGGYACVGHGCCVVGTCTWHFILNGTCTPQQEQVVSVSCQATMHTLHIQWASGRPLQPVHDAMVPRWHYDMLADTVVCQTGVGQTGVGYTGVGYSGVCHCIVQSWALWYALYYAPSRQLIHIRFHVHQLPPLVHSVLCAMIVLCSVLSRAWVQLGPLSQCWTRVLVLACSPCVLHGA